MKYLFIHQGANSVNNIYTLLLFFWMINQLICTTFCQVPCFIRCQQRELHSMIDQEHLKQKQTDYTASKEKALYKCTCTCMCVCHL